MLKTQRSELDIHIDQMLLLAQPLFIYTYGKQVLLFITYSSCTTEQATCDVKDNTLIFTLNTRATALSPVG